MADKTIGDLTQATELNDDALLVAEQNGEAVQVAASSLKKYAVAETVLFTKQELTEAQKAQARENIGVAEFTFTTARRIIDLLSNCVYVNDQSDNIDLLLDQFGPGTDDYELVYDISESELSVGYGPKPQYNYRNANTTRTCYVGGTILLRYGYIYKFVIETRTDGMTVADFRLGVQAHNAGALALFNNGATICTSQTLAGGTVDDGWQVSGYEFTVPETITDTAMGTDSSMNPGFAHMSFKRSDDTAMEQGDISRILVYRKAV